MSNIISEKRRPLFMIIGLLSGIVLSLAIYYGYQFQKNNNATKYSLKLGQTPSQELIYADQMESMLKEIDLFIYQTGEDWDTLLNSTIPDGEITYNEFIEGYAKTIIAGEDLQKFKESKAYSNLIENAHQIIDQGIKSYSEFELITPPPSIKNTHEDLSICIESYIERKKLIILFLEQDVYISPPNNCISYYDSRDQIFEFIKKIKTKSISF